MPNKTTKNNQTISKSPQTMEELLASLSSKPLNLSRGQEVTGEVVSVKGQEVVVDLGIKSEGIIRGIPNLKVGDKITAFVFDPENESGQVALTLNRANPKPNTREFNRPKNEFSGEKWEGISQKYKEGDIVKGLITKITQFGVFVKLEEGVEGLIHISKLGPDDNFETGKEISVNIDSLDSKKKRISLSLVLTSTKGLIYK